MSQQQPLDDWKSYFTKESLASKTTSYQSDFGKFFGCCCFNGKLMLALAVGFWAFGLVPIENLIVFSCLSFHSTPF
jgi:hypothetical protein